MRSRRTNIRTHRHPAELESVDARTDIRTSRVADSSSRGLGTFFVTSPASSLFPAQTPMKRAIYILTFGAVAIGGPLFAYAGFKHLSPVLVQNDGWYSYDGRAQASVSGTVASANNIEYFRCSASDDFAQCRFQDANYETAWCWTNDPSHVAAISTVGAASYVSVTWNETGFGNWCQTVTVDNGSAYVP